MGFAEALGRAIRHGRTEAGLSLRQLERESGGRFKPSAVGGYERGERDLSVGRFVDLAYAIGVAPEDLLATTLSFLSPRHHREVRIDLTRLGTIESREAAVVAGFAQRLKLARHDYFTDVITLRAGDLQIVAGEADENPAALLESIDDAISRVGPES